MKRSRSKAPVRLTRDAEKLITLATGLVASGSRAEDNFWEGEIARLVTRLMAAGNDAAIESALDQTFQSNAAAHDALIELVESAAESTTLERDGERWDLLLVAVPLVAWSRYSLPAGAIPREVADSILAQLHGHVLAGAARAALSPYLYSIDQMPRDFSSAHKLLIKMGEAALAGTPPKLDFTRMPETAQLLADSRFLLATVAVPAGGPLFRWQEIDGPERATRAECLERWLAQCRPNLARILPGSAFQSLLPDAYFTSCREADRSVRPYAIRAGVSYLEHTLKARPEEFGAVVAGFGDERVDEFRVAFTRRGRGDVVHGIVWPLYGREDDENDPATAKEVMDVLAECKLGDVLRLQGLFNPEFCEDCGAPLFADAEGEMQHPELPEDADTAVSHYH